jgi:Flp pilus assembly protein TadG
MFSRLSQVSASSEHQDGLKRKEISVMVRCFSRGVLTKTWGKKDYARSQSCRQGVAAVEFAVCLPLLFLVLFGLWEVGRMTEVQQVMWNSAREAARDASLGQSNLQTVTNNLITYLQSAEPTAFGQGHTVSLKPPVVTLPPNTYGYTVWDNTAGRELFTMSFADMTNTTVSDPTGMSQLDRYEIGVQVPYASIGWLPVAQITGKTRLYVAVDWASMVDAPFQIAPYLPAQ